MKIIDKEDCHLICTNGMYPENVFLTNIKVKEHSCAGMMMLQLRNSIIHSAFDLKADYEYYYQKEYEKFIIYLIRKQRYDPKIIIQNKDTLENSPQVYVLDSNIDDMHIDDNIFIFNNILNAIFI